LFFLTNETAARVLGVTARFFEGVFFTELGDAVAVTRCRDDARVSGLVLLGPMGSDREQALAEISGFYLFTFHIFKRSLAPVTAAININIFHVHILFRTQRARASYLGLDRVGASNRAEPAENRRAQRRHRFGRHTRNLASNSHGRLESGVDLFGRASRGLYRTLSDIVRAQNTSNIGTG